MVASSQENRGLAHGAVGPARVIAFGTSIVAPAGSVVTALVLVMSFAGFASPLASRHWEESPCRSTGNRRR